MSLLTATDLGHSYGMKDLFEEVTITINQKDRIGLVGPNGAGKTTFLRILAGLEEATAGEIRRAQGLTFAYLRQEAVLTFAGQENTIYQEMLSVFDSLHQLEAQMRQMEAQMSDGSATNEILAEYGRIQEAYEMGGGYAYQVDIKRVLLGLGFSQEEWETPLTHLSGGQKTRVLLGRLLLEKPDLLILDEPTNHLDVTAVEWLEKTLRTWEGALLIVSHDRYFLDRVVNHVWELNPFGFTIYRGNYSSFVQQRREAWEREMSVYESEMGRIESEIAFIRKHIAGGKTDMAKGKLRRLSREVAIIEAKGFMALQDKNWIQVGERVRTLSVNELAKQVATIRPPQNRPPRLNVKLKVTQKSERLVLRAKKLTIGYAPDTVLFKTGKIKLERYDCAALIGSNGSGKSTFLKTLLGDVPVMGGKIHYGENVQIGYFAQAHDQLNLENQVLKEIRHYAPQMTPEEGRKYLAQYLFRGHDVFKLVGDLSGGERGRLALAILALQGANFLLLDEPTNHLDIPSQEVLQEVLEAFEGTILLVSHDRYLVNRLATHIYYLQDDFLRTFEGTYQEFLEMQGEAPHPAKGKKGKKESKVQTAVATPPPAPTALDWIEDIVDPAKAEKVRKKTARQRREILRELDEAEGLQESLQDELTVAEAIGDEIVPQLQDELSALDERVQALYDELEAIEQDEW